jgi:hypothetical protein
MHMRNLTRTLTLLCVLAALPAAAQVIAPSLPYDPEGAKVSVITAQALSGTNKLPPGDMRKARKALIAGAEISDAMLRDLADKGDSLAAQHLVRRLVDRGLAANASDIAWYGSFAVGTGKVFLMRDTIAAMRLLNPETEPTERKRAYVAMLYPHAWAGNTLALDAVIELNGEGRLFGPMSDETRAKVKETGEQLGGPRFALRQAVVLLQTTPLGEADRAEARRYLAQAVQSADIGTRTTAENLLRQLEAGAPGGT